MRFLSAPCLLALLLTACHSGADQPGQSGRSVPGGSGSPGGTAAPAAGPAAPPRPLAVGSPTVFAGSDWALYALPLDGRLPADASADHYDSSTGRRYSDAPPGSWDILFYNARTGQLRPLAGGRRLIVWSVEPVRDETGTLPAHSFAPGPYTGQNLLLYSITTTDSNHDGQLSAADLRYLFVSTKAGEHFRQVSPDSLHVTSWTFQPTTGRLLLETVRDRNHNHQLGDPADEAAPYVLDLSTSQPATPVLPDSLTHALQQQLARQWPPRPQ